jgi:peptide/nickel transport system substrate-binding protein
MNHDRKGRSHRSSRRYAGLVLGFTASLAIAACGSSGSTGSSGAAGNSGGSGSQASSNAPQTIKVGGFDFNTADPGATTGFIGPELPMATPIYGLLFDPPTTAGGAFVPDLATSYSYAKDFTSVTITLRSGQTFQDGTPFNAAAIAWNIKRYAGAPSPNKQWYSDIASATATNDTTLTVKFTHPDTNFVNMLAYTSGGLFSSPTAFQKAGAAKYGLHVVGAGPFEVASFTPAQELDLVPFPKYWNASKVKLTSLKYVNTPTDATVAYQDLVSGSIDSDQLGVTSAPANVLDEAKNNSNLTMTPGPDTTYLIAALNTTKAPFNNPLARQAIAYCTNHDALATAIAPGLMNPTYVMGGSSAQYYPFGSPDAAKAQYPYPYNAAKASALVKQLGGLSFSLTNFGGIYNTVSNALAQSWKACGINAQVSTVTGPALEMGFDTGTFQMSVTVEGGLSSPLFYRSFQQAGQPQASHVIDPLGNQIPDIVAQLYTTNDADTLQTLVNQMTTATSQSAALIPLVSGPNYSISNKCVTGVNLNGFGANFTYASKTC